MDRKVTDESMAEPYQPVMTERHVEGILNRVGVNSVFRLLLLSACFGYVFDALDNGLLGYAMPLMAADFHMGDVTKGYLLSIGLWGGVLGQFVWGWLADKKGRLFAFKGTILSFAAFTGLTALAWSPTIVFLARFVAGAGLNGFVPVDATMVSEFSPTSQRGRYTGLIAVFWPVGAMLGLAISLYMLPRMSWRWLFVIGVLPAVVIWNIRRRVPESPRWLMSQGRVDETVRSLKQLGATDEMLREELAAPEVQVPSNVEQGMLRDLFSDRWIRSTILAWFLWFANLYASLSLIVWLPSIFIQIYHLSLVRSLSYTLATTTCGLIGRILAIYLLEKAGRRFSLGYSLFLAGVCMLAFGFVTGPKLLLVVAMLLYFFNEQAGVCEIAYIPELFPTRMRMKGNAWCSATARIVAATSPILVGYLLAVNRYHMISIVFSLTLFIPFLIFMIWGPETKGRGLEEVTR
jgi:MFS transporter, putative metabolite:H+ symporter